MRILLAIIFVLFGIRTNAVAEPYAGATVADVADLSVSMSLRLVGGEIVTLDGLLPPDPHGDRANGAARAVDELAYTARVRLQGISVGQSVRLKPLAPKADRWGRIPADVVRIDDDVWLQELLLREGLARIGPCPLGDEARLTALRTAEAAARAGRRGLWRIKDYAVAQADAAIRVRGFVVVEGVAVSTGGGRKARYLNFGEDWRKDFTLRTTVRQARSLKRAGIGFEALVGRKLRARGWLVWKNGPMLDITCSQQIEALEP